MNKIISENSKFILLGPVNMINEHKKNVSIKISQTMLKVTEFKIICENVIKKKKKLDKRLHI